MLRPVSPVASLNYRRPLLAELVDADMATRVKGGGANA